MKGLGLKDVLARVRVRVPNPNPNPNQREARRGGGGAGALLRVSERRRQVAHVCATLRNEKKEVKRAPHLPLLHPDPDPAGGAESGAGGLMENWNPYRPSPKL